MLNFLIELCRLIRMGVYCMKQASVMRATLGRLPIYLDFLKGLDPKENGNISATTIAKELGLGEVQVRKDLSAVSGAGRPKLGYKTSALIKRLEDVLGRNAVSKAVIIGAGKLGNALLGYNGFSDYGLEIAAAFDKDEEKTSADNAIFPIDALSDYCKNEGIRIGILTVPVCAAQEICDLLIDSGVTAIWNFAPCQLNVPEGIILQQENLALSLAHLKLQMDNQ